MIKPEEIKSIQDVGEVDKKKVKLIKTLGGLNVVSLEDEAGNHNPIFGSSHQAIALYNLNKKYGKAFIPYMTKNEENKEEVFDYSNKLNEALRKKGYDLFLIKNETSLKIVLNHHNLEVFSQEALEKAESLEFLPIVDIKNIEKSEFARQFKAQGSIIFALIDYARATNKKTLEYTPQNLKIKVQ
jgi:hypothetical protein